MKTRVQIKPIDGEPILDKRFNDESDADRFIMDVTKVEDDNIIYSTEYKMLVIIKQVIFNDDWVEVSRDFITK